MTVSRWIIGGLVALVAYLSLTPDKFPYPPQFVEPRDISMQTLSAPPAPESKEFKHELDGIIARQAKLTDKDKAAILSEDHIKPEMLIYPVLGEQYTPEHYPVLYTLLKHAASDAWRLCDMTQDYWRSPRPWGADQRVKLLVSSITRPGYPSGHTTTNAVWAEVLSELFPEKRAALFTRAYAIGEHRIDAGVHFPHDVEGGKKLAKAVFSKMRERESYKRELAAAAAELKAMKEEDAAAKRAGKN